MALPRYPTAWEEIANLALTRLGKPQIDRLDEGTPSANYCQSYLGETIDYVLGIRDWSAPRKRVALGRLSTAELGYDYAYELPADLIRLVEVDAGGGVWVNEGGKILTDAEAVTINYIKRPESPSELPPHIIRAIIATLAFRLTTPLTMGENTTQRLRIESNDAVIEARRADHARLEVVDQETGREAGIEFDTYLDLR